MASRAGPLARALDRRQRACDPIAAAGLAPAAFSAAVEAAFRDHKRRRALED